MADPITFGGVAIAGIALGLAAQSWRYGALRDRLDALKEQNDALRDRAGVGDKSVKIWPRAKFRDYLTTSAYPSKMRLNQWALLLCGYEPNAAVGEDPMDMPAGVYRVFIAIKNSDPPNKIATVNGEGADRDAEVTREELRRFYRGKGSRPLWLFPGPSRISRFWRF